MKKRILSILLSLLMVLTMVPQTLIFSSAAVIDSGSCGENVTYTLDDTGKLTISGTGNMADLEWYNSPWYNGKESIKTVVIENGVTSIGRNAFEDCTSLTGITISDSVTSIGAGAFTDCTSLKNIVIPAAVTSIDSSALKGCTSLIGITVIGGNKNYASIDGVLFNSDRTELIMYPMGNSSIKYEIPAGVKSIGNKVFYGCKSLTDIIVPDSVTSIGDYVFSYCSSLTGIKFSKGITDLGLYTFKGCTSLTGIEIPAGATSINEGIFSDCTSLTDIRIPAGVTIIDYSAFAGCTSLTGIEIPAGVKNIGGLAFSGCTALTDITIPAGATNIDYSAFADCKSLKNITIPASVASIGNAAFKGCKSLKNITIPDKVTSINFDTFRGCTSLSGIKIPAGVTSIGDGAFYGCTSLKSITIPDSVTKINYNAFGNCISLENVSIGSGLENSEHLPASYIFENCISLKNISVDKNNKNFCSENGILYSKDKTILYIYPAEKKDTSYTAPASLKSMADFAFAFNRYITEIKLPAKMDNIGGGSFKHCINLKKINIPEGIAKTPYQMFYNCKSITEIKIPSSVTAITYQSIYSCENLKKVEFPANSQLKEISWKNFNGCGQIKEISIPASVEELGDSCFEGTESLEKINVSPENKNLCSENGIVYTKDKTELKYYPQGKTDKSFTVPASVTDLNIRKNSYLQEIKVQAGNIDFAAENGVLYNKDKTEIICYPQGKTDKSFTVPASVERLYYSLSYDNCMIGENPYLQEIKVQAGNKSFAAENGILYSTDKTALECYPKGKTDKSFTVPASVEYFNTIENLYLQEIKVQPGNKNFAAENGVLYNKNKTYIECYPQGKTEISLTLPETVYNLFFYVSPECKLKKLITTNPECYIRNLNSSLIIYGPENSKTKMEAIENGNPFIAIGENKCRTEFIKAKAPTYSEEGNIEYYICKDCGKMYKDEFGIHELTAEEIKIPVLKANYAISSGKNQLKYSKNEIEKGTVLNVKENTDNNTLEVINKEKGNYELKAYDIFLTLNNKTVQPNGCVLITMPLPEGFNAEKTAVYYAAKDKLEKVNSYVKDGVVYFETDHFSTYVIVDETKLLAGDMDGDGKLTAADARTVLRASVGLDELSNAKKTAADVDNDKKITAADARIVLRKSVGLSD